MMDGPRRKYDTNLVQQQEQSMIRTPVYGGTICQLNKNAIG